MRRSRFLLAAMALAVAAPALLPAGGLGFLVRARTSLHITRSRADALIGRYGRARDRLRLRLEELARNPDLYVAQEVMSRLVLREGEEARRREGDERFEYHLYLPMLEVLANSEDPPVLFDYLVKARAAAREAGAWVETKLLVSTMSVLSGFMGEAGYLVSADVVRAFDDLVAAYEPFGQPAHLVAWVPLMDQLRQVLGGGLDDGGWVPEPSPQPIDDGGWIPEPSPQPIDEDDGWVPEPSPQPIDEDGDWDEPPDAQPEPIEDDLGEDEFGA